MNWAQIQALALSRTRLTALSDLSAVLVLNMSAKYRHRRHWDYNGEYVNVSQWDEIEAAMSELEDTVMKGFIGAIIPHVLADLSGFDVLECDGASYARLDYPELYAVIHPDLIIDADNFRVPDLLARFPRGAGALEEIGGEGGEIEHVLTVLEIPAHSHDNLPHNHTELIPIASIAGIGVDAPVPSAIVGASVTGAASIVIENTGGDVAHNNEPQFTNLRWLIVAR